MALTTSFKSMSGILSKMAVYKGYFLLNSLVSSGGSQKKPITTNPRAIRLATISNLLEKQTTQMNKIVQMVQPLQKQLKLVETRTEFIKQIPSQLKQLQKEMSHSQKESQKLRSLLSK